MSLEDEKLIRILELKEVTRLIKSGSKPDEISLQFPELFIEKSQGVISLYEHIHKKKWRFQE